MPDSPDAKQSFDEQVQTGVQLREACRACVHQIPGADAPSAKATKQWIASAGLTIPVARMTLEHRRAFAQAMATGSPQDIFDAFNAGEHDNQPAL
jgi:hypothetical protein